jgi:hypothetical protein
MPPVAGTSSRTNNIRISRFGKPQCDLRECCLETILAPQQGDEIFDLNTSASIAHRITRAEQIAKRGNVRGVGSGVTEPVEATTSMTTPTRIEMIDPVFSR